MNEKLNDIEAEEITERDNLAVVYEVERLESIPNKDRIELVHLKDCGYTTICEKGHKVGDLVVFVKYDSVVPQNELFDFMKDFKYRVKPKSFTERDEYDNIIKKIYSQGIVLPYKKVRDYLNSCCPDGIQYVENPWNEGFDLTTDLGIKKYIAPVVGSGSNLGEMRKKGDFPTHLVSKTDEMNICSRMKALEEIQGKAVYITQKIEGSSLTFYLDDATHELIVCTRNNMIEETLSSKFWQAVNKNNVKEKLLKAPDFIFQAELYGVGVQKNKLGIPDVDFAIFNIVDKKSRHRLGWNEMEAVCHHLELPCVPLVYQTESFDWTFDQLQEFADKQKYASGELAEGVVVRPEEAFFSLVLRDVWSVKCINREYRL